MPANSIGRRRSFSDEATRKPFARPGIPWIDTSGRIPLPRGLREAGPIRWPSASGSSPFSPREASTIYCWSGYMRRQGMSSSAFMPTSPASGLGTSGSRRCGTAAGRWPGSGTTRWRPPNRWVNALFASAHLVTDLRTGTPDDRAPLPRPARRYRVVRAGRVGAYLSSKEGKPGQVRALHRGRLHELGRFVEERILRGEAAAPLSAADLEGIGDARTLMSAVKAHHLRAGRDRRYLSYRIPRDKNSRNGERARFAFEEGEFDVPDLLFRRDDGGKS